MDFKEFANQMEQDLKAALEDVSQLTSYDTVMTHVEDGDKQFRMVEVSGAGETGIGACSGTAACGRAQPERGSGEAAAGGAYQSGLL